ncbi:MAG: hypothetical protein HOW59_00085 [Nonomuraea sp.]|nr:hypothetical protein [Nonomuraea sp.]
MRQGRDGQSRGVDHLRGGLRGTLGGAALWPASVLAAAVAAELLRRRFPLARLRLADVSYELLERTGVRAGRPRLTDRQRLDRQLRTWRQARPDTRGARTPR